MPTSKTHFRELTAGEIADKAKTEMHIRRCHIWRQNNHATRGRKFTGKLGVSDLIGFHTHTGQFVAVEVKTIGDRLSDEQIDFLGGVCDAGGYAFIATQNRQTWAFELNEYKK